MLTSYESFVAEKGYLTGAVLKELEISKFMKDISKEEWTQNDSWTTRNFIRYMVS